MTDAIHILHHMVKLTFYLSGTRLSNKSQQHRILRCKDPRQYFFVKSWDSQGSDLKHLEWQLLGFYSKLEIRDLPPPKWHVPVETTPEVHREVQNPWWVMRIHLQKFVMEVSATGPRCALSLICGALCLACDDNITMKEKPKWRQGICWNQNWISALHKQCDLHVVGSSPRSGRTRCHGR